jgi:hypothetical protein
MEPSASLFTDHPAADRWESYPLISPTKFVVLCLASFGLYGLWWQYKTWRFFKQWKQADTWPAARALFSFFTFNELLQTINEFSYSNTGYTPIPNTTGLTVWYIVLNLLGRLPDPLWIIALGAVGFEVPAFRAFRDAMLDAPGYGGSNQRSFSTRQVVALIMGILAWSIVILGLTITE